MYLAACIVPLLIRRLLVFCLCSRAPTLYASAVPNRPSDIASCYTNSVTMPDTDRAARWDRFERNTFTMSTWLKDTQERPTYMDYNMGWQGAPVTYAPIDGRAKLPVFVWPLLVAAVSIMSSFIQPRTWFGVVKCHPTCGNACCMQPPIRPASCCSAW